MPQSIADELTAKSVKLNLGGSASTSTRQAPALGSIGVTRPNGHNPLALGDVPEADWPDPLGQAAFCRREIET